MVKEKSDSRYSEHRYYFALYYAIAHLATYTAILVLTIG